MTHGDVVAPDGARVAWRVVGEGAPEIALIMGFGLSSDFFFDFPEQVQAATGASVLLIDNRGTGDSPVPEHAFSLKDLAGDLLRAADAAGADRLVVAGTSMGGMIAQHVALEAPERVSALALFCTHGGVPGVRPPGPTSWPALFERPFRFDPLRPESLAKVLLSPRDRPRAHEIFDERWTRVWHKRATGRGAKLQLRAVLRHAAWRHLRSVTCPVEILHGTADVLIPYKNGKRLQERLPDAHLTTADAAGHGLIHTHRTLAINNVTRAYERSR